MINQSLQSRFGGLSYDESRWLGAILRGIHTLGEVAIGRMEDSHILEVTVVVVGMRPAVKSNLATTALNQRLQRQRQGPRRPAIRQCQLPLVSSSSIEEMRLASRLGMTPLKDPEGLCLCQRRYQASRDMPIDHTGHLETPVSDRKRNHSKSKNERHLQQRQSAPRGEP